MWATFLLVLVPLLGIYSVSNEREHQNVDAIAAALPAWRIATHGDLTLDEHANLGVPWLVNTGERVVSQRPPGTILTGVPFYLVAQSDVKNGLPSLTPSAFAGTVTAALAMAMLHVAFRRLVSASAAVVAALVAGLATSTWTISSDQLWPHGPVQLWMATAVVLMGSRRHLATGLAFAMAIFTRPVTAFAAAGTGLSLGWLRRHWKPVAAIGGGALLGVAALSLYNITVFDTRAPINPFYGGNVVGNSLSRSPGWYAANVGAMLVAPLHGILLWSPLLLVLAPGLRRAWAVAPEWVRSAAVGGAFYMLVHLWLNRQSGGLAYNYRYPLAMLTLAAPLLLLAYREWVARSGPRVKRYFAIAVGISVTIQAAEAWVTHQSLFLLS